MVAAKLRAPLAMPSLLHQSSIVQVLILNPGEDAEAHGEPGADIALYLARHGIKVEVCVRFRQEETGEAICSMLGNSVPV